MKSVSVYRPTSVEEAIQILSLHGTESGVYAGGTDLLIQLKNRIPAAPTLSGGHQEDRRAALHQGRRAGRLADRRADETGGSARIADLVAKMYPMLTEAVGKISSPELRNASTVGGDMLQQVWCQYLRGGYSCYRNGGYICYGAIGDNSYYHSVMGGRLCYAVYPGDIATALITHDAKAKLATPFGMKEMTVEQLVPGDMMVDGKLQSHVVRFNEILTEVTHASAEARVQGVVREAAAAGRMGLRDGLAGARLGVAGQAGAGRASGVRRDCREAVAGEAGGGLPEGQDAEHAADQSGDGASAGECRAAEVQRNEGGHGQGPAGFRHHQARLGLNSGDKRPKLATSCVTSIRKTSAQLYSSRCTKLSMTRRTRSVKSRTNNPVLGSGGPRHIQFGLKLTY